MHECAFSCSLLVSFERRKTALCVKKTRTKGPFREKKVSFQFLLLRDFNQFCCKVALVPLRGKLSVFGQTQSTGVFFVVPLCVGWFKREIQEKERPQYHYGDPRPIKEC